MGNAAKFFNQDTEQWEYLQQGPRGEKGEPGEAGPAGGGDVDGPESSTDNAIARFDSTTGKIIQNSNITISDSDGQITHTPTGNQIYMDFGTSLYLSNDGADGATLTLATSNAANFGTETIVSAKVFKGRLDYNAWVSTSTSSITPAVRRPNWVDNQLWTRTAQAATLTINAPYAESVPVEGDKLMFKFRDNGTSRTLSWDAIYKPIGVTLPTATVANKWLYVEAMYNAADSDWHIISVKTEA